VPFQQLIPSPDSNRNPLYPDASLGRRIAMNSRIERIKIEEKAPHCCGLLYLRKIKKLFFSVFPF
jgi:hypothetical protein